MKCPYCTKEMKSGFIPNGQQPVQWIPDGGKPSFFSFATSEKGVVLKSKFSILKANGYMAKAYYCEDCDMVVAFAETKDLT